MSTVPATVSKVAEAPPKNAVTHTVSTKQRQEDVDRKVSSLLVHWCVAGLAMQRSLIWFPIRTYELHPLLRRSASLA